MYVCLFAGWYLVTTYVIQWCACMCAFAYQTPKGFAPGGGVPSKAASARRKPPRKSRAGGSTKNTTHVGGDIAGSKSDAATPLFSRFKAPVQSITYGVDRLYSSAISGGPVVGGHEATPSKGTALSVSAMTLTAYGKDMQERVWDKAKLPVNHFMRPTDVKYKVSRFKNVLSVLD